jgi:hypothetical protein
MTRSFVHNPASSSSGVLRRWLLPSAAALATLLCAPVARADNPDPSRIDETDARVRYTLYPAMKATSSAPTSLQSLSGDLHEADAQLRVPIVANEGKTIVLVGLGYTYTHYDLSGLHNALQPTLDPNDTVTVSPVPTDLHAITASVGLAQRLSKHWSMLISLKPGMYSDMRAWDSSALGLQGLSEVSYHASDDFTVGLGFSYESKFGTALLLPLLQLNWNMGAGFRFVAVVPSGVDLLYQPTNWLAFDLFGRVTGGAYRIHPSATLNQADPTTGQTSTQAVSFAYDLAYSTISVGPGIRARLFEGFYAFAEAPLALKRRWEASNLCWNSGGKTECVDGPTSLDLTNLNGKYSIGVTGGLEQRF